MSDPKIETKDRIEILGQVLHYPTTIWGTLSVIAVVIGVCTSVWIVTVVADPKNIEAISTFVMGRGTLAKTELLKGHYQIQFWTPSARTKESGDVFAWEGFIATIG